MNNCEICKYRFGCSIVMLFGLNTDKGCSRYEK